MSELGYCPRWGLSDAIVEEMVAWQHRPLDRVYPVVLIDAIVIKVRDAQVANRPV